MSTLAFGLREVMTVGAMSLLAFSSEQQDVCIASIALKFFASTSKYW